MTINEALQACTLLDVQYGYIGNMKNEHENEQQSIYYDGMKTMIEHLLTGTGAVLIREADGTHHIDVD